MMNVFVILIILVSEYGCVSYLIILAMVPWVRVWVKIQKLVHFKYLQFILCHSYLNKTVLKKFYQVFKSSDCS